MKVKLWDRMVRKGIRNSARSVGGKYTRKTQKNFASGMQKE